MTSTAELVERVRKGLMFGSVNYVDGQAHAALTELAERLSCAEGREAELRERLEAAERERDDLRKNLIEHEHEYQILHDSAEARVKELEEALERIADFEYNPETTTAAMIASRVLAKDVNMVGGGQIGC